MYSSKDNDEYDYKARNYDDNQQDQFGGYNMNEDNNGYEDEDYEQVDEKGFEKRQPPEDDIFIFKKVELPGLPKNQDIKKFIVSEETRVIITKSNRIYRWRVKMDPEFRLYEIPDIGGRDGGFLGLMSTKQRNINIRSVYLDSKGYHCLIVCDQGNTLYLNYKQSKIRVITKLKGIPIKSVSFHSSGSENKSGYIMFSSENAIISLLRLEIAQGELIQNLDPNVLQLNSSYDVLAIQILRLNQTNGMYVIILMSTVSSIFCITGADDLEVLLRKFRQPHEKVKESMMPRGVLSFIRVCYSKISKRPVSILWTNGKNFLLIRIPDQDQKINDNILNRNQLIKFAKKTDLPIQIAFQISDNPTNIGITDFHYYILFQQSLTIMSLVTQKIVLHEDFKGALISDMTYQQNTGVFWIYEPKGVIKLDTSKEGTEAWKLLIAQKKYKEAYNVCKAKNENLSYAAGLYADDLFSKKKYEKAAMLFSETSRTFQEIFLKYLQVNTPDARDGLRSYLNSWLQKIEPDEKTQRCLLLSWLIELIVYDLNNLERMKGSFQGQKQIQLKNKLKYMQSQLERLLQKNLDCINENLVYLIMQSHGRIQNLINFADQKGNLEMIIIHYLSEQSYDKALDYLKNVRDGSKVADVVYKYSHIFFRYQSEKTVNLLTKSIKEFKPIKLMPGLMNIPDNKRLFGIQLLKYCVEQLRSKQKSLHNILIFFYATTSKQKIPELIDLMKKGRLDFDLDFGLRLFKNYRISEAQIIVYGKMYLYAEAVSLALENNKEQLAKEYAEKPDYEDERKKLWIQIAKHYLVKKSKISQVIELTKRSKVIKIEDLLPYFNQNIKIENFKDEICQSLKSYSEQIQRLKSLMDSYSTNAEQLKNQLRMIKNRCIEIDSSHKCQECFKTLFSTQFYIFPCMHGFHRSCLFETVKGNPTFNRYKVEKISVLNEQINQIKSKIGRKKQELRVARDSNNTNSSFSFMNAFNLWGGRKEEDVMGGNNLMERDQGQLKVKKDQIDSILAAECVYCGPGIVDTITMPFENQQVRTSWKI